MRSYGPKVLFTVVGAFSEMLSDVGTLADVIATSLAADHIQIFPTSAVKVRGMC